MNTQTYFAELRNLISCELRAEQELFQHRMEEKGTLTAGSVVCEPDCRFPIELRQSGHNALGKLTIELAYETRYDESELEFEPGQPVSFFALVGSEVRRLPHQCYVEQVYDGKMVVSMPGMAALQSLQSHTTRHTLGVQVGIDNTSYQVMTQALHDVENASAGRAAHLREVLIGHQPPAFRHVPRLSFPWLNISQQDAIQKAIEAQDVAIVHGPPGTGKTTTLVEAIVETLQHETQVLVCAPSNTAVDWISEQLMRRGIHVLRIGNPLRMSREMLDCSYERRYAAHPDYHELWSMRRELSLGTTDERRQKLMLRQAELDAKIQNDLFVQASVVCCTLIGSAYQLMSHRHFGTLFIDEAAQALEPACWAAITKADRVVMGGDHQQLPPTVKSAEATRGGLTRTLMQKVASMHPQCVSMLNIQYRMNQSIMEFPSRWFYGGRLKAAPEVAERLASPLDTPLMWIDTSTLGGGEHLGNGHSLNNATEARLLIHTLRHYIEMITPQKVEDERMDFGIITPYRNQARLIRRLLRLQHFFRQLRRHISVGTVDGFQGQERDVILISLVRDNPDGNIGFLRDLRRMNVAMTRARMKLIIVGNTEVLSRHHFYRALIGHIRHHGIVVEPQPTSPNISPSAQ